MCLGFRGWRRRVPFAFQNRSGSSSVCFDCRLDLAAHRRNKMAFPAAPITTKRDWPLATPARFIPSRRANNYPAHEMIARASLPASDQSVNCGLPQPSVRSPETPSNHHQRVPWLQVWTVGFRRSFAQALADGNQLTEITRASSGALALSAAIPFLTSWEVISRQPLVIAQKKITGPSGDEIASNFDSRLSMPIPCFPSCNFKPICPKRARPALL
jgi:hypothetical protein